ncbi:MAG TPA: hypothetical protein VF530_13270 [Planctomycetota bacterium]
MTTRWLFPLLLLSAAPGPTAQEGTSPAPARFAPPVLLEAGDKLLGARRLYPSPGFHDVDGDGRADLVIGDLWGRFTVARRLADDGPPRFGAEDWLLARDGEKLDFSNW